MSFHSLRGDPVGSIILVNLHYLVAEKIVDARLRRTALRAIRRQLNRIPGGADGKKLIGALSAALHVQSPVFQVRSRQKPDLGCAVAMILDFGKVKGILRTIQRRLDDSYADESKRIDTLCRRDVGASIIPDAAALINALSPALRELTLSDPNRVLWGTSAVELESAIARFQADPAIGPDGLAGRLRDLLGLVHIDPKPRCKTRHLFLFRGRFTLAEIKNRPTLFRSSRPSVLDGFDNRRFCQPWLKIPWENGWGMTIDIASGGLGIGLPEIVVNPLSLCDFDCSYLGEVPNSWFGPDKDYLTMLSGKAPALDVIATELDRLAA